jgi:solute carrier family 8 (sodium/calcium exchanger)
VKAVVDSGTEKNCDTGYAPKNGKCTYTFANGYVEINAGERICKSFVMIPGSYLINTPALVIFVLLTLLWLFMGIGIISDIFMEAIEEITAQTKTIELWDRDGKNKVFIDVPLWNATVANLTLMALGSSAPEILLSVIGTV